MSIEALGFPEHADNPEWELADSRISKLFIRRLVDVDRWLTFNRDRGADVPAADELTPAIVAFLVVVPSFCTRSKSLAGSVAASDRWHYNRQIATPLRPPGRNRSRRWQSFAQGRIMPDIPDGETVQIKGSAAQPYILKNSGGVYSCTCPAWRNQSVAIERRTCKHLRKYRGEEAEQARLGSALPQTPARKTAEGEDDAASGPPILLAQSWDNDADLAGWWMSEKLDGVRAYWDGQQFLSRQGNVYHAPDWFAEQLPPVPLDGELWLARKSFQRTVSIVRRQDKSEHWREISFLIFDAPAVGESFEERQEYLREALARCGAGHVQLHAQELCRGVEHLRQELLRVEALGGEGLMLRQPGSRYEVGRSSTLLKVKTFHDAEARVVEHLPGAGRHKGRMGALGVELADGTRFSVGTGFSDAQRASPPPIGSTITFRYQELSDRGVPRFPSFVRLRADAQPASAPGKSPSQPGAGGTAGPPAATLSTAASGARSGITATSAKRYFEFTDDQSKKFWEICTSGRTITVRYGRIGADGQTQTKAFADESTALVHAAKLIGEKTAKGYVEKAGPS